MTQKKWTQMSVRRVGSTSEILRIGGGKLSTMPGDPGEPRKPKGGPG